MLNAWFINMGNLAFTSFLRPDKPKESLKIDWATIGQNTSISFKDSNHSIDYLKIISVEHTPNYTDEERKMGEKHLIDKLQTKYPSA